MFMRTRQPGLWFIAGSFAQCRIYSKYLALQIRASEVGLLPRIVASPDDPGMRGLLNTNNPTGLPARSA